MIFVVYVLILIRITCCSGVLVLSIQKGNNTSNFWHRGLRNNQLHHKMPGISKECMCMKQKKGEKKDLHLQWQTEVYLLHFCDNWLAEYQNYTLPLLL